MTSLVGNDDVGDALAQLEMKDDPFMQHLTHFRESNRSLQKRTIAKIKKTLYVTIYVLRFSGKIVWKIVRSLNILSCSLTISLKKNFMYMKETTLSSRW